METLAVPATRKIQQFETAEGGRIFQILVEVFPGFWGTVYLVLVDDGPSNPLRVLIDTGSGFGDSNLQLEQGLSQVAELTGETVSLANLTHVLITHGHIDHFGGLSFIRPMTGAKIGVHELDRRILTNHEERVVVVARRLNEYLAEAGVSDETRAGLLEYYKVTKGLYRSVEVDFTYESTGMKVGPFELLHTPGHCAGHVVIRLHDVLFSGDHVLAHTSPHQSPEHLTLSTGLDHYLQSLDLLKAWADKVRLTLGGHERPILDLPGRIDEIRELHRQRLEIVLELLGEPHTVTEISQALFGEVHGYNVLLAIEETGAHVEYLYQRGLLGIENLSEIEGGGGMIPIRYTRLLSGVYL